MKVFQLITLTAVLVIGFSLPSCNNDDFGPDCNCEAVQYFDVTGLKTTNYTIENGVFTSLWKDSLSLADLGGMLLQFDVSYHAMVEPQRLDWSFSLINTANACTCLPGYNGSKTESIVDLSITTLNDFDDAHLANSSINDLLSYSRDQEHLLDSMSLTEFLDSSAMEKLEEPFLFFKLQKAPELNPELHYRIRMELSTGEVYEVNSVPLIVTP